MKIPAGSTAKVKLPVGPSQNITVQKNNIDIDKGKIEGLDSGRFKLNEGSYIITVSTF